MEFESNGDAGAQPPIESAQVESVQQAEPSAPSQPVERPSIRDALSKALDKVERGDTQPAPEAPETIKADNRVRNPDGTFAPKAQDATTGTEAPPAPVAPVDAAPVVDDAPARFSVDAKAAWKDAPPALKGEIKRAITELEGGISQYQARFESYKPLDPYISMAQQSGVTLDQALKNYVGAEQLLRSDPMRGIDHIIRNAGLSPQQYAQAVMNLPPDQQQMGHDRAFNELRAQNQQLMQTVTQLQQQFGTVSQTIEQRERDELNRQIADFSKDKPRFDELRPIMKQLIEANMASDLAEAYAKADRLNPAAVAMSQPPTAAAPAVQSPTPAAQTRKASLSVTGSPVNGSNPSARKPPTSAREALERSLNSVGYA